MRVKSDSTCQTKQGNTISPEFLEACSDASETEIFAMLANDRAKSIGSLLEEKNRAYGNSVSVATKAMAILYPDGIPPEKMDDALVVVRVFDKLCRIARGNKKAFGESPWKDIAGYAILQMAKDEFEEVLGFIKIREKWGGHIDPDENVLEARNHFIEAKDGLPEFPEKEDKEEC